ncbi:hypothetical protein C8R43DRAFT_956479 [Mycena crocata]|nr:hypothetical protein C8R43DRAFT_956479 [Mycena crocata]
MAKPKVTTRICRTLPVEVHVCYARQKALNASDIQTRNLRRCKVSDFPTHLTARTILRSPFPFEGGGGFDGDNVVLIICHELPRRPTPPHSVPNEYRLHLSGIQYYMRMMILLDAGGGGAISLAVSFNWDLTQAPLKLRYRERGAILTKHLKNASRRGVRQGSNHFILPTDYCVKHVWGPYVGIHIRLGTSLPGPFLVVGSQRGGVLPIADHLPGLTTLLLAVRIISASESTYQPIPFPKSPTWRCSLLHPGPYTLLSPRHYRLRRPNLQSAANIQYGIPTFAAQYPPAVWVQPGRISLLGHYFSLPDNTGNFGVGPLLQPAVRDPASFSLALRIPSVRDSFPDRGDPFTASQPEDIQRVLRRSVLQGCRPYRLDFENPRLEAA